MPTQLHYGNGYWTNMLGKDARKMTLEDRLHLLLSLLIFLQLSLTKVLEFIFTSKVNEVRTRASIFMAHRPSAATDEAKFAPQVTFRAWQQNFPDSRKYLGKTVAAFAQKIATEESDRVINDPGLKVKMKTLTLKDIQSFLEPEHIMNMYREHAPFTCKKGKKGVQLEPEEDKDWEDDPNLPDDEPDKKWNIPQVPEGFTRNPEMAVMISIVALSFTRNRATNLLPLILGLFFKISVSLVRLSNVLKKEYPMML
ncbi:hypothetical protein CVT26_015015 [Gymnopilus dilepis]|uniref:Uncharacterized protein n=1 Tax=Gymnopilus dilepis TaxID=231916 RepID=A0A409XBJ6_9AGAR|nr:hypothetical protein CVT26_015015 [Gymnopilus dilepis]